MQSLVPTQNIAELILFIRGKKVMLDSDLARLYRVETKALNRAVRRNLERFPEEFMFQLTSEETGSLISTPSEVNHPPSISFFVWQSFSNPNDIFKLEEKMISEIELGQIISRKIIKKEVQPYYSITSEAIATFGKLRVKFIETAIFEKNKTYVIIASAPEETFENHKLDFNVSLSSFGLNK